MSDITPFHWHGTWDEFNEQVRQAWDGREGRPLTAHVGHAARPESPPSPPTATVTPGQAAYEARLDELLKPVKGEVDRLRGELHAAALPETGLPPACIATCPPGCDGSAHAVAPAPELAAAMAETRAVRDGYRQLCGEFGPSAQSGWSARISLTVLNRHLARAGLAELPRSAALAGREDLVLRYRRERDEARESAKDWAVKAAVACNERDEAREQLAEVQAMVDATRPHFSAEQLAIVLRAIREAAALEAS